MIKKIHKSYLIGSFIFLLSASKALAEGLVTCSGASCGLNDFINTAVKIANWLLGIAGSLTLLMFVYGGTMLLISGGSSERVAKGKTILTNGIIGLVIVLLSYLIIGFVFTALGADVSGTAWAKGKWFTQ